jgi:hypothetical protein
MAPFFAPQKNRAIRSNLFYRFAVKKDFHSYPWRMAAQNELPELPRQFRGS